MKKSIYLMTIITLLVFAWSTGSWAADKIGFINLQEIMQGSNAGKKAAEEFKKFYDKETQFIIFYIHISKNRTSCGASFYYVGIPYYS